MKKKILISCSLTFTMLALISYAMLSSFQSKSTKILEVGYVVGSGRAPAIIKVWEEKSDNTRGRELISERWIQRDESIKVETERGRIIYDYKYRSDDSWKTDVHAWCHRGDATKVP